MAGVWRAKGEGESLAVYNKRKIAKRTAVQLRFPRKVTGRRRGAALSGPVAPGRDRAATSLIPEVSEIARGHSSSEGVLAQLVGGSALSAPHGHLGALTEAQSSAEGTVLLLSEVNGRVALLLEFVSGSVDSLLAQHGQHLGDVLPDHLDLGQLHLGLRRDLGHAELGKLFLQRQETGVSGHNDHGVDLRGAG